MADSKLKYLALYELLKNEASKEHPLTTSEICKRLQEKNISKDRRNLPREIDALSSLGYAVNKTKLSHENAYYVETKELDENEIRIILDALQASTFITEEKTQAICEKIVHLANNNAAKEAVHSNVVFTTRKTDSSLAVDNVSVIAKAIRQNHSISFKVFDYDENHEIKYHDDGSLRTEEPIALVFNKDKYYLLTNNTGNSGKDGELITYRVDRIDCLSETEIEISEEAKAKKGLVSDQVDLSVSMYGGKCVDVVLEINTPGIIKYIYEEFGNTSKVIKIDENKYYASIKTNVSPTLYGWLFQFCENIRVVRPSSVREEYLRRAGLVK